MIKRSHLRVLLQQITEEQGRRPLVFHFRCEDERGRGGVTIATIDRGQDRILGAAMCSPLDSYNRAHGSYIALRRAQAFEKRAHKDAALRGKRKHLRHFTSLLKDQKDCDGAEIYEAAKTFATEVLKVATTITPYKIQPIKAVDFVDPRPSKENL